MAKWFGPSSGTCSCNCEPPGFCWDCDVPVGITVAQLSPPAGDGCASVFDGTYLFNSICVLANPVFGSTTFTACDFYPSERDYTVHYICQYDENSELVSGTGYTDYISYWWVIAPTITQVASAFLTSPRRLRIAITYALRLYQETKHITDDSVGDYCTSELVAEVTVLDTFILEVADCVDLVDDMEIPHDSRTFTTVIDPGLTILGNLIAYNTTAYTVPDPCEVRLQI